MVNICYNWYSKWQWFNVFLYQRTGDKIKSSERTVDNNLPFKKVKCIMHKANDQVHNHKELTPAGAFTRNAVLVIANSTMKFLKLVYRNVWHIHYNIIAHHVSIMDDHSKTQNSDHKFFSLYSITIINECIVHAI